MAKRRIWFEREFALGLPQDAFPDIVERLRGTPCRLEERTIGLDERMLTTRFGNAWSIQEHAGHLLDLEALWMGRLVDLQVEETTLRPADLENTKTEEAKHNEASLNELLAEFRNVRMAWVDALDKLTDAEIAHTALHPRLGQPMGAVDLGYFVAEHDDHHLAAITSIRKDHEDG